VGATTMTEAGRIGCYPGSFNPATIAHIAIAEAAWQQFGLARVDLVISGAALGKPVDGVPSADERANALRGLLRDRPWIGVVVTERQLLAEIAGGYDVLVMGADKWSQISEPGWYSSEEHREAALQSLPQLAIAPRPPHEIPAHAVELQVSRQLWGVSSTGVRSGRTDWRAH
jgi:nicotinic acid mononucleotide adenylyltransferase